MNKVIKRNMNKVIKGKWLKALRSGKYSQGEGLLNQKMQDTTFYCCLGVLCEVVGVEPDEGASFPPEDVLDTAGIGHTEDYDPDGDVSLTSPTCSALAAMNDGDLNKRPKTFKQIANWIEKNL